MKRIVVLASCALTILVLASSPSVSAAEAGQISDPAVLDLQVLQTNCSAAPLPAPQQPNAQALPVSPMEQRIEKVCFWYPTGECCAGGLQVEEWICDPSLTRCGPRSC